MQLVRVHGPDDVRLDDVNDPQMGPRDAIVRVAACGVCGSDLEYIALGGVAGPTPEPMPLGHELAGTVSAVGPEVSGITVGDRVVVHPGDDELGRIGNGAAVAALAEPLGPIGLAALATLVDRGNEHVIAVDLSARRLELAEHLGAQAAINAADPDLWDRVKTLHGTAPFMFGPVAGTDAYIEASGAASVVRAVLDNAKPLARMSVVALHYADIPVSFLMLLMKQFTICGAMEYPDRFEAAIELLARRDSHHSSRIAIRSNNSLGLSKRWAGRASAARS
jgi:threonine dehydrogenase-like Zn-dependent dehydrogenase